MNIKVVSFTNDIERHIAYCARVSNPENQNNKSFKGLLKYCIKHSHWSVFEHGYVTLEIKISRTIARQLLRHRSFTFQEFSQRYAAVNREEGYIWNARSQDLKNRQSSNDDCSEEVKKWFDEEQVRIWNSCLDAYEEALEKGIAKEQARVFLPEGMSPSVIYMTGNLRSWIHFCQLRSGNGSQMEIQRVAIGCLNVLKEVSPTVFNLIE